MKNPNIKADKFWDKEYDEGAQGELFKLSDAPGSDLIDFIKWLEKIDGKGAVNKNTKWLDIGCGNGRHGLYLLSEYGATGLGYDISSSAIEQANAKTREIYDKNKTNINKKFDIKNVNFQVMNISKEIPIENKSIDIAIVAMSSHVLREAERSFFYDELKRVIAYKGYIFLKTFLRDGDILAQDLIGKHPDPKGESHAYIHPKINIYEHVPSESELAEIYSKDFEIEQIYRSHFHPEKGRRRYIVMYLRKK